MESILNNNITKKLWGEINGKEVYLFTLQNQNGNEATVTNYGATWVSFFHLNAKGEKTDVLLGYDNFEGLRHDSLYMGAIVGRYANRIANGKCTISGKEYTFAVNNGPNHLHGGIEGFHCKAWDVEVVEDKVIFSYESVDGEEGYPGNLKVSVSYQLTNADELIIEYAAVSDQDTIVNMTNHAYFNLKGKGTAVDHIVRINADKFTPANEVSIPTGELREVTGVMDFRSSKAIQRDIAQEDQQLIFGKGYDHNYVLNKSEFGAYEFAASAVSEEAGRRMEMYTTEPGVQFYTANWIGGTQGKAGAVYEDRDGFCFEAQHYPDSPNQDFPTTLLKKGEAYKQKTTYKFSSL